jgi:hypothetical protein
MAVFSDGALAVFGSPSLAQVRFAKEISRYVVRLHGITIARGFFPPFFYNQIAAGA